MLVAFYIIYNIGTCFKISTQEIKKPYAYTYYVYKKHNTLSLHYNIKLNYVYIIIYTYIT